MTRFFIAVGSERSGPFTLEELSGPDAPPLDCATLVWVQGMTNRTRAGEVAELADVLRQRALTPSPARPVDGSADDGAGDFILLNPKLPRIARAICVYAIVVSPALFIIGTVSCLSFQRWEDYGKPGGTAMNLLTIAATLISAVTTTVIVYGGFQLRARRRRSLTALKVGFIADIAAAAIYLIAAFLIGLLSASEPSSTDAAAAAGQSVAPAKQLAGELVDWLVGTAGVLSLVWEIACLVWLFVRGKRLPLE